MLLVVSSSALPLDNQLARGAEFLGKCFRNRLSFVRLDYRFDSGDVSCLAQESTLFMLRDDEQVARNKNDGRMDYGAADSGTS